ncbi:MAG: DUF350 domain-containing protein [Gammaproteobacteria bacterium]|nr:DUF350 domain-containing protein [Gammaproteobacteria bacterium]
MKTELGMYPTYFSYALLYLAVATLLNFYMRMRERTLSTADSAAGHGGIAFDIRHGAAHLGLAIAMIGVMYSESRGKLIDDLMLSAGYSLLAALFMIVSLEITDKVILPGIRNVKELVNNNLAVAFVEAGALVMTGNIAYASIRGEEGGIVSSISYFLAGQLSIVALVYIYEKLFVRKHDIRASIQSGKLSAGIYLSSKIVAYGLIIQSVIVSSDAAAPLADKMLDFSTAAVAAMIMLYLLEILIDKIILLKTTVTGMLDNDRVGDAVQLALTKIGMAMLLGLIIL